MKHTKILIGILGGMVALCALLCLTSCEEEMKNFEVETAEPQLVIDAECSSMKNMITVRLSKTVSFVGNEPNPPVGGATVVLRYSSITMPLIEMSEGLYIAYAQFPENTTYELSVEVEGKTYTATSYMPKRVKFTEVKYEKLTQNPMFPGIVYEGDTTYMITLSFLDPPAEDNFYRVVIYRNDTLARRDLTIMNDTYFSADTIHYSPWQRFYENDVLSLELRSFDRTAYRFYSSMQAAMEAGGAFSVPDNPISNFSGGALGHFTAYSGDTYTFLLNRLE